MSKIEKKFRLEGMTCALCAELIEKELSHNKNLASVKVNFASETMIVQSFESLNIAELSSQLESIGYRISDKDQMRAQGKWHFINKDFYHAFYSLVLASLTMFFAMVVHNNEWQFVFSTILILTSGFSYIKSVFKFKNNMQTLIGLGVLSSYFYSAYLYFLNHHSHLYLESASFILAFALLGHYLDGLAKTKAQSSLTALYKMQLKFALKVENENIINTPVKDLQIGDHILVKPGEKFPLDGEVVKGQSHANESLLTGESTLLIKKTGDSVVAGSLNIDGTVTIKISSTLNQNATTGIIHFVEQAQLHKAPIQKLAEKIIKIFVPSIILLSLITFFIWYLVTNDFNLAITFMTTVLVIACPCAIGLAVPMAIFVSTTAAAKDGILIKSGDVIERATAIDTVVFDKTGTLTVGEPTVESIEIFDQTLQPDDVLFYSASAAQYSTHPLSQSIFQFAKTKNIQLIDPDHFKNIPGEGFLSSVNKKEIVAGKIDFVLSQINHNISEEFKRNIFENHLGSYVFISIDKKLSAVFVINDTLKTTSAKTVSDLNIQHYRVVMLTGDNKKIADSLGNKLGLLNENILSEVGALEKASIIAKLQENHHKVAMIGDGINDAPALSKSFLSVAMAKGSDIAIEASDISLLDGDISLLPQFFYRSKKTMRIIKQNLLLSIVYNALALPLAVGVFHQSMGLSLSPMWASLAMSLSSLSVILNSLRAR